MSTDFGKAYEVLGVKPGVSARELKTAHRDLAKVWHPDRFLHDPRLQEKAQEKLKEINEAYEQLISGRMPRPAPPPRVANEPPPPRRASSTRGRSRGYGFALLTFMAVFALTISTLLRGRVPAPVPVEEMSVENVEQAATDSSGPSANKNRQQPASPDKAEPLISSVVTPVEALPTVTVLIDPHTGLLATSDCPVRTKMTYPSGGQPQGYCNAPHPPKTSAVASESESQKESAIKSFTKRLGL
ncbi:MAG TPA: J domain-containing protein [Pyrinomonadaceae bacterium]|nr:J domain-containing protein [Pyrinomonadaceae bacterium]